VSLQAEGTLQREVAWRLKAMPMVALPIPNGLWIPARTEAERSLVARIVARMKADGMLLPGAPDLGAAVGRRLRGSRAEAAQDARPVRHKAGRTADGQSGLVCRTLRRGRCASRLLHELGRAEGEARQMGRRQTAAGAAVVPVVSRAGWSVATIFLVCRPLRVPCWPMMEERSG
jgi:hypothetical protein